MGATSNDDIGATVGQWNALIRRARIGRDRKAAALILSSYARANGTQIHCGVARLAVDMECSHRTARRYLAWLRAVGLIELVREGNRRRGHSDEYRLILRPDILETLDVPDPSQYASMCRDVNDATNQGTPKMTHDDHAPAAEDQGSLRMSHDDPDHGSNRLGLRVTLGDPSPSINTSQVRTTSQADAEDPRTDVAVGGPAKPESGVVVELFPGASREAPYRTPARRWSTRGQDSIAEATARCAAARDAHRSEAT